MSDIKMGEYQSRNGLEVECPDCHIIYNNLEHCQTCTDRIKNSTKNTGCCTEMINFIEKMEKTSFIIGSSEISGSISIEPNEIRFDDGWNDYPTLYFRYCPFCGVKNEHYNS